MTLTVTGGGAGIAARVVDMRATADVLDTQGDVARELAGAVAAVAVDEAVLTTQVFSPLTGGGVLAAVGRAQLPPTGLAWLALEYEAGATFLRGAATAYETTDAALALIDEVAATAGGLLVINGALLLALPTALAAGAYEFLPDDVARFLTPDALEGFLEDAWADPLSLAQGALYDHPWVTDSMISALPTFLGVQLPLAAGTLLGVPLPVWPLSYEQVVAGVIAAGGLAGYFHEGQPTITLQAPPVGHDAASWHATRDGTAATSLESMFANISGMGTQDHSEVRVTAVPDGAGGYTWLVEIPGTQAWDPASGSNPSSLSANLHAMSGSHDTAVEEGVRLAIAEAMGRLAEDTDIPLTTLQGQPVTLAGHSQGGIIAASIAADPNSGLNVTGVVTGGSPVANHAIPDHVSVLSIEHAQDPVPNLDGNPNPGGPNWTTVSRDIHGHADVTPGSLTDAHNGALYADTAAMVDAQAATDPALQIALADLDSQFEQAAQGGARVFQYDVTQDHP